MKYEFTLVNEKLLLYNHISWLIIFLHLVIYIYLGFFSSDEFLRTNGLAGLLIFAVLFILFYFLRSHWKKGLEIFFLVMALVWVNMKYYGLAIIPGVFYILNNASTRPKIVVINDEYVLYPSFPVKKLEWNVLSNVVLKDGLLTIDLKNNHIIQQRILEHPSAVEEIEFNEFCKNKLREHKGLKESQ